MSTSNKTDDDENEDDEALSESSMKMKLLELELMELMSREDRQGVSRVTKMKMDVVVW